MQCEVASECARLRHNWLGNKVLNFDADFIAEIYSGNPADHCNLKEDFTDRIKSFGRWLDEAREFLDEIVMGFSPVQLVESGPLMRYVPNSKLLLIKNAVHQSYLEQTQIQSLKEQAEINLNALEIAYSEFIELWQIPSESEFSTVKDGFQKVLISARELHNTLCLLPRGVVLP